ncbi:iron ABC transporter ATP-binding protein [Rathayibacter sp. YIM 133350]|uniref:iron ABC transporter ATP-binding protein n=1 Tax=Rathayibacter sp. YIM 133350 TaxID=3131992 RepID=UPI00307DAD7A
MPRLRSLPLLVALPAALTAILLSGCTTPGTTPSPSPTRSSSSTASASPEPSASPTPTADPEASGTPVGIACDALLTPDDVYSFNPNFGTAPDYSPSGGDVGKAVDIKGVACGWSNQTSGDLIEIAVAKPDEATTTKLRAAAAASLTPVPTYGTPPAVDGFFAQSGGTGEAQVFSNGYWLTARSVAFFEPGDAAELIQAALSHLP